MTTNAGKNSAGSVFRVVLKFGDECGSWMYWHAEWYALRVACFRMQIRLAGRNGKDWDWRWFVFAGQDPEVKRRNYGGVRQ